MSDDLSQFMTCVLKTIRNVHLFLSSKKNIKNGVCSSSDVHRVDPGGDTQKYPRLFGLRTPDVRVKKFHKPLI